MDVAAAHCFLLCEDADCIFYITVCKRILGMMKGLQRNYFEQLFVTSVVALKRFLRKYAENRNW